MALGGAFLAAQWLRLGARNAGGLGSIPGQGTKSHTPQLRVCMLQVKTPPAAAHIRNPRCCSWACETLCSQQNKPWPKEKQSPPAVQNVLTRFLVLVPLDVNAAALAQGLVSPGSWGGSQVRPGFFPTRAGSAAGPGHGGVRPGPGAGCFLGATAWQPVACPASGQRRKALDFVLSAVSVPVYVFSALSQTLGWLPWAPLPSGVTVELSIPDSW